MDKKKKKTELSEPEKLLHKYVDELRSIAGEVCEHYCKYQDMVVSKEYSPVWQLMGYASGADWIEDQVCANCPLQQML